MNLRFVCVFCFCLLILTACSSKKNNEAVTNIERLPLLNITLKIPPGFQSVPLEPLGNMEILGATMLDIEPFTVIPLYAYTEGAGKGIIIISQLQFREGAVVERFPMDNIFIYRKNLETFFGAGEISSDEINGRDISTILLAMMFNEEEDAVTLFKGLSHYYPDRFFMIDLYLVNDRVTLEDAFAFQDMFFSLGIY